MKCYNCNQKISNETRNQNYEHLKFMQTKPLKNWKTSLIKYSEKQLAMGIQWYKELKDQLMKTSFNSEEKYLEEPYEILCGISDAR